MNSHPFFLTRCTYGPGNTVPATTKNQPFCLVINVPDTSREIGDLSEIRCSITPDPEVQRVTSNGIDQSIDTLEHLTEIQLKEDLNVGNQMVGIKSDTTFAENLNLVGIIEVTKRIIRIGNSEDVRSNWSESISTMLAHNHPAAKLRCITSSCKLAIEGNGETLNANGMTVALILRIALSDTVQENGDSITRTGTSNVSVVGDISINILTLNIESTLQVPHLTGKRCYRSSTRTNWPGTNASRKAARTSRK